MKKYDDMFSRFDTIPAYAREMSTERQSASSGKNRRKVHSVGICNMWTKIRHTLKVASITGRSVVEKQFNRIRKLSRNVRKRWCWNSDEGYTIGGWLFAMYYGNSASAK